MIITTILIFICLLVLFILEIEFLIIAFRESVLWGLACLFFTPACFFFTVIHWQLVKVNVLRTLAVIVMLIGIILFSQFGSFPSFSKTGTPLAISTVFQNSLKYDGKTVELEGSISSYKEKVSRIGNNYTTFTLSDQSGSIVVHYRGHARGYNGQQVKVKGQYAQQKRVGRRTFYNQIEAYSIDQVLLENSQNYNEITQEIRDISFHKKKQIVPQKKLVKLGSNHDSNSLLTTLYKNKLSKIQVRGSGKVVEILKDDLDGSKHQRFILKVSPDLTILVAHNIDISTRVSPLNVGDKINFYGQYEWNEEGGVVHWTHHDPIKKHRDGYLERNGKKFQ